MFSWKKIFSAAKKKKLEEISKLLLPRLYRIYFTTYFHVHLIALLPVA